MTSQFRRMVKLIIIFIILISSVLIIVMCKKKKAPTSIEEVKKNIIIQTWFPGGLESQIDLVNKHAKAFEEKYGVKVNVSHIGWEEMRHKLRLAVDSGSAPHVVKAGFDMPIVYAVMRKIVPLDDYIKRDNINVKDYAPSLIDASTFEGKCYGIPITVEDRAIYYRKDLLQEVGISEIDKDWTWDDLKEIARKVNNPPKVYGYAVMAGLNDQDTMCWFEPILKSFGGDYFDKKYTKSLLNSDPAIKAFKYYTSFVKERLCPSDCVSYGRDDVESGFTAGKFAMVQSGPWLMKRLHLESPELEGKWDVAPMPGAIVDGKYRQYVFSAGVVLMMFDHGEVENEYAWKWIEYETATEQQKDWFKLELALGSFSGMEGVVWSNPKDEECLRKAFIPYLGYGDSPPKIVSRESFGPNHPIPVALHEILINGKTPEEAANIAAEMYNQQLKQAIYRP